MKTQNEKYERFNFLTEFCVCVNMFKQLQKYLNASNSTFGTLLFHNATENDHMYFHTWPILKTQNKKYERFKFLTEFCVCFNV